MDEQTKRFKNDLTQGTPLGKPALQAPSGETECRLKSSRMVHLHRVNRGSRRNEECLVADTAKQQLQRSLGNFNDVNAFAGRIIDLDLTGGNIHVSWCEQNRKALCEQKRNNK